MTEELITRREEVALISDEYFTVTVTGLVINGEPTVASWKNLGKQIKGAEGSILWNLGDWANFGEVTYEDYAAIRDKLGYTTKTVKDAKLVASAFKIARRRADLSWSFYREALSLASDGTEADELLERAAEEDWTIKKLRKEAQTGDDGLRTVQQPYRNLIYPLEKRLAPAYVATMSPLDESKTTIKWQRLDDADI